MTQAEIAEAVNDDQWQAFRRSLKGTSTRHKLLELIWYMSRNKINQEGDVSRVVEVRVDNYINALLRGGQLVHRDGGIWIQR